MLIQKLGITRQSVKLSDNVDFVYFERPGTPLHLQVLFNYGARHVSSEKSGLAHFTEHMLLVGSEKFKTVKEQAAFIDQYGGYYNAYTGGETLGVEVSIGDPDDFVVAVDFLSQVINHPLLPEEELESTKKTIVHEITQRESDPSSFVWKLWNKAFFQETALANSVLGSKEEVMGYTIDEIRSQYNRMLNERPVVIVGAGGTPFKDIQATIQTKLHVQSKDTGEREALPIVRKEPIQHRQYSDADGVHIVVGFRTVPYLHKDLYPLVIIKNILANSRASRLTQKLRYDLGLVYSVRAYQYTFSDAGSFVINTTTSHDHANEVLAIIAEEFARICEGDVTNDDLSTTKNMIIKSKRNSLQSSRAWVDFHSSHNLFDSNWTVETYLEEITAVSLADLKKVGEQYFKKDTWFMAVTGNIEKEEVSFRY